MNAVAGPLPAAALSVEGLGKHFPARSATVVAVEDVSFTVLPRQVCVLLGPSGCGKSTVLRMIAGLETPSAGRITLSGRPVCGPGRERGMVFQGYTSFPWLNVRDNVAYGLRINGDVEALAEGTVAHFLERVGLAAFAGAWPHQLSGGMRQRVALARCLAQDARIVLMDEPLGALDAMTRDHLHDEIEHVARTQGLSVIFVTHNMREAIRLGDRVILMGSLPGRIVYEELIPLPHPRVMDSPEVATRAANLTARLKEQGHTHVG